MLTWSLTVSAASLPVLMASLTVSLTLLTVWTIRDTNTSDLIVLTVTDTSKESLVFVLTSNAGDGLLEGIDGVVSVVSELASVSLEVLNVGA